MIHHSTLTIALVGAPNSGKTSLFNALTGLSQKVGNYPGVTVERKAGDYISTSGKKMSIIDLPGLYSLNPQSIDEQISYDILNGTNSIEEKPDYIIVVIDSSSLERSLSLALELSSLKIPMLIALNMIDLAKSRGLKINTKILSDQLGAQVVETVATSAKSLETLHKAIDSVEKTKEIKERIQINKPTMEDIANRFKQVEQILKQCVLQPITHDQLTLRLDKFLLHKIWGNIFLFLVMLFMFQSVFSWASTPMEIIDSGFGLLGGFISNILPDGLIRSLLVDGIIAGVGAVLIFLPQILILFFFIFLLEGTGYMARAAFLLDRFMASIGLQGRSFVPLLSSFACAIPGIMATRTIKNPKDRIITILIAPLMTCSARLPVYVVLIGAFIPSQTILGIFNLQGIVFFLLFLLGIFSAVLVGFIARIAIPNNQFSTFILELPTYKLPSWKNIIRSLLQRGKIFLKKAGTVIMGVSIGLWFLSTFPKPPNNWQEPAINYSFAGRIGKTVEPVFKPLGFDWRISTGLIPGFAAREVMVGALGTVFAIENADEESEPLRVKLAATWGIPTGLALLVWYVYSPQCLATMAVAKKETNSWKWPAIMFAYMISLAYLGAFLTFKISSLFF